MNGLVIKTHDDSIQTYEQAWVEFVKKNKGSLYRNPSASLYTSMVYGFANHLPYSMDIEQPEYVPSDFLNMTPLDVDDNNWFKWEDRRTFFNSLVRWGDTFKTGMLLQMCNVFQKMILGQFPREFELTEEHYTEWGISTMTRDKEYNRCFFETLKLLPTYYKKIVSTLNNDERRKMLDEMYNDIMNKIAARFGGFKETDACGNIIREQKGSVPIRPGSDVQMIVYWDNITFHDGIPSIIQRIKDEQLKTYHSQKEQHLSGECPSYLNQ